jgi:hypothetical protein
MRTLEQVIEDCAEIARNKQHAAAYILHKHGRTEDWKELQENADEHEQLVKWLMELKRYRDAAGYSGKLERKKK